MYKVSQRKVISTYTFGAHLLEVVFLFVRSYWEIVLILVQYYWELSSYWYVLILVLTGSCPLIGALLLGVVLLVQSYWGFVLLLVLSY